jgi:hypothetical protein
MKVRDPGLVEVLLIRDLSGGTEENTKKKLNQDNEQPQPRFERESQHAIALGQFEVTCLTTRSKSCRMSLSF